MDVLPRPEEFKRLNDSTEEWLALVVQGHYAIDSALNRFLCGVMRNSNALELRRISFLLKVDILCAMGLLGGSERWVFEEVNSIRNKFAHNPYYVVAEKEKLRVCAKVEEIPGSFEFLAKRSRDSMNYYRCLFVFCYGFCVLSAETHHERRLKQEAAMQALREILDAKSGEVVSPGRADEIYNEYLEVRSFESFMYASLLD